MLDRAWTALALKMEFILTEADEQGWPVIQVSDNEMEENIEDSDFIDHAPIEQESIGFYRNLANLDHYPRFQGQTRDSIEVAYSDTDSYFGEDNQPEPYDPENRDFVNFDKFKDFKKSGENFKKTLLC